jgi:hypothetical protein
MISDLITAFHIVLPIYTYLDLFIQISEIHLSLIYPLGLALVIYILIPYYGLGGTPTLTMLSLLRLSFSSLTPA